MTILFEPLFQANLDPTNDDSLMQLKLPPLNHKLLKVPTEGINPSFPDSKEESNGWMVFKSRQSYSVKSNKSELT